jgi:hypothetical protein
MNKEGYVIARNRARKEFFTSSSAYDRPVWTPVTEATVYVTADLAHKAVVKLATRGAYEARIVTLKEALTLDDLKAASDRGETVDKGPGMEIEMPSNSDVVGDDAGMEMDIQPDGEGGTEMVASDQQEACETCMHCPCTCDPDETDMDVSDIVDDQVTGEEPAPGDDLVGDEMDDMGDEMSGLDPARPRMESAPDSNAVINWKDASPSDKASLQKKGLTGKDIKIAHVDVDGNEVTYVKIDGKRHKLTESDNKTVAIDLPVTPVIQYKDAANKADKPATDLTTTGAMPHDEKVKVPANVMSELRSTIGDFRKCADLSNGRDDAKASFCMTVVSAFEELEELFKTGTVESVKMAQVKMTSWMNPITSHLPVSVQKFIFMGGRKPTLKDMFDSKKQEKRAE